MKRFGIHKACGRKGFTLVELLMVMAITVFVLAAATRVMVSMVFQFKQQSKIAEGSIEGIVGLEIVRSDLSSAGHGLAGGLRQAPKIWQDIGFANLDGYSEVTGTGSALNDAPNDPPSAFAIDAASTLSLNDSDYLAIRSVSIGTDSASGKYHLVKSDNSANVWTATGRDMNLASTDWGIMVTAVDDESLGIANALISGDQRYAVRFGSSADRAELTATDETEVRIFYGISSSAPKAPFNRVDYYVASKAAGKPSAATAIERPARCAPGTGVLVRAPMSHATGKLEPEMPIVDCVADFQVVFELDTDSDGDLDTFSEDLAGLTAKQIRDQVRQVRIYILMHEGQIDARYEYPSATIRAGDAGLGREPDMAAIVGSKWKNYRWRVLRLIVKPSVLR